MLMPNKVLDKLFKHLGCCDISFGRFDVVNLHIRDITYYDRLPGWPRYPHLFLFAATWLQHTCLQRYHAYACLYVRHVEEIPQPRPKRVPCEILLGLKGWTWHRGELLEPLG